MILSSNGPQLLCIQLPHGYTVSSNISCDPECVPISEAQQFVYNQFLFSLEDLADDEEEILPEAELWHTSVHEGEELFEEALLLPTTEEEKQMILKFSPSR